MITPQDVAPLSLVIDNTTRNATLMRFSHLSDSVWAHKPREVAISERNSLLLNYVRVQSVPYLTEKVLQSVRRFEKIWVKDEGIDDIILMANNRADSMRRIMQEWLHDKNAVFRTSSITSEIRSSFKDMLNAFLLNFNMLSGEIGELSSEWQTHAITNLRKHYDALASLIRGIAWRVITREEIEYDLKQHGYYVFDETVVKLLIFEVNKASTDPQFLALPSYHPYNPLICSVEYDDGTFPELRPILSLFAFLDEYPS